MDKKNREMSKKFIGHLKQIVGHGNDKIMTQSELAQKIGYTEASVSRYLNNERSLSIDAAIKICNALKISKTEFINFYSHLFEKKDNLINRFDNLSLENQKKVIEYVEFLEYQEKNKKLELKKKWLQ